MRTLLLLLLFIPVLSWAKLVTTTYATLTNVIITYKPETGASEHTLVVPPDYPSYTLAYTCTYDEGSYTLDIEVPDDPPPEEEEVEQEDGEGDGDGEEDGGVTFETSVVWSVERSGAIIDGSTTTRDVTVKFLEGNTEDVVLKVEVTVECTAGNGVGTHDSSTFKIHSPVWDTYHSISMYAENATIDAPRCAAVGEDVTFTVQLPNDSEYDRRLGVDIKTYLDDLKGPNSPRWNRPDALLGEVIVGDSVTWTASDTPTTEPAEISVVIDDSPYPKPPNERGTTDDDPYPLDAIQITIVAVDSLLPDIGEEIDDDDDDPDTRTFVLAVADTGVVTVEATPSAVIDDEKDLPEDWSLTGGTGTGKLLRTINRAAPGIYTITCECGTSKKTTEVIVTKEDTIEVSCPKADNSPQTFMGRTTDFGNPCATTSPGQALTIFYDTVLDTNFHVKDFDITLKANVKPTGITADQFCEKWRKSEGAFSGSLNRADTFEVMYQSPKVGGLYKFEFDLGFLECSKSGANIHLPLAGADMTKWLDAETKAVGTWASEHRAKVEEENYKPVPMLTMYYVFLTWCTVSGSFFDYVFDPVDAQQHAPCRRFQPTIAPGGHYGYVTVNGVVVHGSKINNMMWALFGRYWGWSKTSLRLGAYLNELGQDFRLDGATSQNAIGFGCDIHANPSANITTILTPTNLRSLQDPDSFIEEKLWPSQDDANVTNSSLVRPELPTKP